MTALFPEVLEGAHGYQTSLMDDPDSIRQFFGNGKLVGGEKYRHSLLRSLLEDVLDDPSVLRIQI